MPRTRRAVWVLAFLGAFVVFGDGLQTYADATSPGGSFVDDDGNLHEGGIEAIFEAGITQGCNPPANDRYCPDRTVTRGQMAVFLSRALALADTGVDYFADDDGHIFENGINRLRAAGITQGCNPPTMDRFCPDREMTRGEMAAMLARAFDYPALDRDRFVDDDGHIFESAIEKIAAAGVTVGCNPPTNDRFCPDQKIKRDQMATFLTRALHLTPIKPPSRPPVGSPIEGAVLPETSLLVETADGTKTVPNQRILLAEVGADPDEVLSAISASGGSVLAYDPDFGVYQLTYRAASAAVAGEEKLKSASIVMSVEPYSLQEGGLNDTVPADWADDGPDAQWPFRTAKIPTAWDTVKGSASVHLGIVDAGIFMDHEDLRGIRGSYETATGSTIQNLRLSNHGTHVAGTMCAQQNGIGLVGVMWECRLHALDLAYFTRNGWDAKVIAPNIDAWLRRHPSISVVNLSFTAGGAHETNGCSKRPSSGDTASFARLFDRYPKVLFVVAGGNCGLHGGKYSWATPSNLAGRRNVLAVGAIDAARDTPESFRKWRKSSTPDSAEGFGRFPFYAPGGVFTDGTSGVWSTTHSCSSTTTSCRSTYGHKSGTSMASPMAAGVAGLLKVKRPSMTAEALEYCVQENVPDWSAAGSKGAALNAVGALECTARVRLGTPQVPPAAPAPQSLRVTSQQATDGGDTWLVPVSMTITSAEPRWWSEVQGFCAAGTSASVDCSNPASGVFPGACSAPPCVFTMHAYLQGGERMCLNARVRRVWEYPYIFLESTSAPSNTVCFRVNSQGVVTVG